MYLSTIRFSRRPSQNSGSSPSTLVSLLEELNQLSGSEAVNLDYNAKLSDFGFATDGPGFTARVIGTSGYAAPEYVATGHLTGKLDVYGFGVVMLELLSGKPVVDASEHKVVKFFDARMEGQYSVVVALKAAKLANQCLSSDPKFRPNMNEVVKALEQLQECSDIQGSGISQNESHHSPRAKSSTRWKSWISFRPSASLGS